MKGVLKYATAFCVGLLFCSLKLNAQSDRLIYNGGAGAGSGKSIVLISGDESYRSEEALPLLAKILSQHHGFKTTVLFATDPETGIVNPGNQTNITGLETLKNADLVIMLIRFRELPDEQMKYFSDYVNSGKPIIALRTSTHGFSYSRNKTSMYAPYSFNNKTDNWTGGFGKTILGETWVSHHGKGGVEGTRALTNGIYGKHAILKGIDDLWSVTDLYTVNGLPSDAQVLMWGQTTAGIASDSPLSYKKSIMPLVWIREGTLPKGQKGKIFTTTYGNAEDFRTEDMRRLIVNAVYWGVGKEDQITPELNVSIPGNYQPTPYGLGTHQKGKKPAYFEVK